MPLRACDDKTKISTALLSRTAMFQKRFLRNDYKKSKIDEDIDMNRNYKIKNQRKLTVDCDDVNEHYQVNFLLRKPSEFSN